MRKKRILFCTEATFLNTGYSTYTREILSYLLSTGKYELAELASYATDSDRRATNIPWKFYGAMPPENASQQEQEAYNSSPTMAFGEYAFEKVCLDFKPDVVCDIRDFWMLDFQERSPFRKFFKWCIMPTVDARPQARQWIATYASADACFTYSDWAGEVLKDQSGNKINYLGSSPPSAHMAYQPKDSNAIKQAFGIDVNKKIIGTVMRNQRRKLYPDLFEAFRLFLDSVENPNEYMLYCHTSYPDMGWDIPELLNEHNISSHVMFTYVCPETQKPFPSLFRGAVCQSPYTGKLAATLSNVKNGLSYDDLSNIINMFDLYVQYANCEGFGLPQVEAAACGVPIMGTDYSAMESVLRQLHATPIKPKALYKEMETGCLRAVPDNELAAKLFKEFFELPKEIRKQQGFNSRKQFLEHFQWDKSGKKWEEYFDSVEIRPDSETWMSPVDIQPPQPMPQEIPHNKHKELAQWLIVNVLRDESKLNSHMESRLTRDLLYGYSTSTTGGMYLNEMSANWDGRNKMHEFNFEKAYESMALLRHRKNFWEQKRAEEFRLL
jgi:glycosyltransferase involved in cell wall biosynthesis